MACSIPTPPANLSWRGDGGAEGLNDRGVERAAVDVLALRDLGGALSYAGPLRRADRAAAAVDDDRTDLCAGALADRLCVRRSPRISAFAASPGLPAADRAGRPRRGRDALVGCALAGADPCDRAGGEAAGDSAADLPVRALALRQLGVRGVPGVLRAADAVLLHCCDRPRCLAEALPLA